MEKTVEQVWAVRDLLASQETEEEFIRYLLRKPPPFLPEYFKIKRVNTGLLEPSEDEASGLELGKNVCALPKASEASKGERT